MVDGNILVTLFLTCYMKINIVTQAAFMMLMSSMIFLWFSRQILLGKRFRESEED